MPIETLSKFIEERQSLFAQQMQENATISRTKIEKLLHLANFAPSHRRTEPWRFTIFQNDSKIEFFNTLASIYKSSTLPENFDLKKFEKIKSKSKRVATIIAIGMRRCPKESVPVFEEEYAVSCAVQNMLLALKPLGIVGYWSTPKMAFSEEMKSFLNLGEKDKCMGFLQLGVPLNGLPEIPKIPNGPIEDKVIWRS